MIIASKYNNNRKGFWSINCLSIGERWGNRDGYKQRSLGEFCYGFAEFVTLSTNATTAVIFGKVYTLIVLFKKQSNDNLFSLTENEE